MSALESYIQNGGDYTTTSSPDPLMKETLAMIAFRPYDHKHDHENHHKLTVRSLAATIESLRRTEMGRVVVMGMVQDGAATLQEALHYLINTNSGLTHEVDGQKGIVQIGHMEVAYVMGSAEYGNTKHLNENIPRATLIGLKVALLKAERSGMERTLEDENTIKAWLGNRHDPSFWKYFYLTEPDCLLHTRRASLPQLKAQLDHGHILAPHRLQPIPHESDVPGIKNKLRFLNYADGFDKVWEIDHIAEDRDVCCDEFAGPDVKPGKTDYDDCGGWWYACGFNIDYNKTRDDPHKRLRPYQVMKLKRGTGLTLIAGNLMARRCFPAKDAVCKPPYVAELSHYHG